MIRVIEFENFYSFKGRQEVSFLATNKKDYSYTQSIEPNVQISKVMSFIGPNASGKTNALRALGFLSYFIGGKYPENIDTIPCSKFFDGNNESSILKIDFEVNDQIFVYSLEISDNQVNEEILNRITYIKKSTGKIGKKTDKIFKREKDLVTINKNIIKGTHKSAFDHLRNERSLIHFLNINYNIDFIEVISKYFLNMQFNFDEQGREEVIQFYTLKKYDEDRDARRKVSDLLTKLGTGVTSFKTTKSGKGRMLQYNAEMYHSLGDGNNAHLPLRYESRGTQKLFFNLSPLIYALNKDKVVVLDELETGLHSEILNNLIDYFIEESNGKSQLIFSSNYHNFINLLNPQQIHLCEKNISNSKSFLYRMDKIEGIRPDGNHRKKYLSGKYGAFPINEI